MHRRDFIKTTTLGAAAVMTGVSSAAAETEATQLARKLPRWRGFNLFEKTTAAQQSPYRESDLQWMADWGFDFVRLAVDYHCWTDPNEPYKFDEKILAEIDQTIELSHKLGIHACLDLHRVPGYAVSPPAEKMDLWTDEEAQKQFCFQWSNLARRYRSIPSKQLSFNLVNEPAKVAPEAYAKVARQAVAAIRHEDPERLIISDGLRWARNPVFELADLGIAQSTHCYDPHPITHYQATWVDSQGWPKPAWPLQHGDTRYDRQWLFHESIEPWKKLESQGVGVHVGEFGVYNRTPHDVALAWMRDLLGLIQDAGWGWAMWDFRGGLGILDSCRDDVAYEDFHGCKLDRKMLALLQEFLG